MKRAILNVKVDEEIKKKAQAVASSFGIPLNTLVNAYLRELAETEQIHFSAVEIITPGMESLIEQGNKDIDAGEIVGPFTSSGEAISYLKKI